MKEVRSEAETHRLIGGALCLDFANTLYGHGRTPLHEYLTAYRDLVIWSRKAGILTEGEVEFLLRKAARSSNEALSVFHRAIALRETLYRVFSSIALGESPKAPDIAVVNIERAKALEKTQIDQTKDGFAVDWIGKAALDRMLWPIVLSAADLLTSTDLGQIRQCAGDRCDWLFVDTSRNHLRRWCSMRECGNRAKVRRFFARKRKMALRRKK